MTVEPTEPTEPTDAPGPPAPSGRGTRSAVPLTVVRWPVPDLRAFPNDALVLVVLPAEATDDPIALLAAGARAVIVDEGTELAAARDAVLAGGSYLSPTVLASMGAVVAPGRREPATLGPREVETLRCIVAGLTHRQAARQLGVTESTVNTYAKRLRRKLDATNKAELTQRAMELGYLQV